MTADGGTSSSDGLRKTWAASSEEAGAKAAAGEDSAVAVSDGEDESQIHPPKTLSRSNSTLSRELAEEEGRVLRAGHRFRSGLVGKEQLDMINTMDDVADLIQDSAETMALYDVRRMTDEIVRLTDLCVKSCERLKDAVFLDKVKEKGAARAFKEDKDALFRGMRDSDPDYWSRFLESQQKARANITAAAPDKNGAEGTGSQVVDESAIAD